MSDVDKDTEAYLARIRKTIEASKNIVEQAELRIAETDRMLERQGLTREQVMAMRFSDAQIEAVNAELRRRGIAPFERWSTTDDAREEPSRDETPGVGGPYVESPGTPDEVAYRQSKFGMMMKSFRI